MRYTDDQKATALKQLRTQTIAAVSEDTDIPADTLRRWQRDHHANRAATREAQLFNLQDQLAENAQQLAQAIDAQIDSAPLNQLATALNAVIDRYLKLDEHLHTAPTERVVRIEYQDAHGNIHKTPPWAKADPTADAPVQGGGLWTALWQDGDGQNPADTSGAQGRDDVVARADIWHGEPGVARPEDDAQPHQRGDQRERSPHRPAQRGQHQRAQRP